MKKNYITVLCGIPASGKSTFIRKYLTKVESSIGGSKPVVVSLDEIRKLWFGHQFHQNAEEFVVGIGKNMVRMLLNQGYSVVVDSTNITPFFRKSWAMMGNEAGAETRLVIFNTSYKTCLKRNEKRENKVPVEVLKRMALTFCPYNAAMEMGNFDVVMYAGSQKERDYHYEVAQCQ